MFDLDFRTARLSVAILGALGLASPVLASELRVVMESRLGNLDPIMSASHQTRDHGYLIYDTLFALDADQEIQPQMVESYSVSEDGKTYSFTLRDGLTWHDGTPVTAEDAVASINRWGQRDRMGVAILSIAASLEATDGTTFVLTLNEPAGVVLDAFAKPSGVPLFIMPKDVAATPFTEQITDYRGSGPFVFVADQYEPGVKSVYLKNEAYVPREEPASGLAGGKIARVDRIERIEMPDPLTALNALNSGEIDFLQTIPFDLLPLVAAGTVETARLDELGYQISFRMNHLQPPFDNKLVRQAALAAIGQEEIMQAQYGVPENYMICGAAFGCGLPYESDVLAEEVVQPDPDRARALLAQSGYAGEPVVIFHVSDISSMSALGPTIAQQLREVGFTVDLAATDFMTMLSRRANQGPVSEGGWSMFITSWHNTEIEDPLRNYMITAEGPTGYAGWADFPVIGEKIHDFLLAPDLEARKQIADEIQGIVYDEVIFAPIGGFARVTGHSSRIDGVITAPPTVFWNISRED